MDTLLSGDLSVAEEWLDNVLDKNLLQVCIKRLNFIILLAFCFSQEWLYTWYEH